MKYVIASDETLRIINLRCSESKYWSLIRPAVLANLLSHKIVRTRCEKCASWSAGWISGVLVWQGGFEQNATAYFWIRTFSPLYMFPLPLLRSRTFLPVWSWTSCEPIPTLSIKATKRHLIAWNYVSQNIHERTKQREKVRHMST